MTKLRSLAPVLLLALAPVAAVADDYRWEVEGALKREMPSIEGLGDADTLTLAGTWYFAPVSTDGVPLAEAAYLGRASSLSAIASRFEWEGTGNAQGARVGYYLPGTMFYGSVGVSHWQNSTDWIGTLGIAPLNGLLITTNFRDDNYVANVTARYVGKLPNDHFYAGSVSLADAGRGDTVFGLDFDYYIDDSFSLGVGYDDGGDNWEFRAEKFFSKSWALGASASTADGGDGVGIHVTWRH